jgi:Ca2+-binding RTX toxin-like protein
LRDTLEGGAGDDVLWSGSGYEVLVFGPGESGDRDVAGDFNADDRIRLDDGLPLASADSTADATGDGQLDTVLTLSDGHVIVLAGWSAGQVLLA